MVPALLLIVLIVLLGPPVGGHDERAKPDTTHSHDAEQPAIAALDEVLERLGQYLVDYERRLSAVVAEERYEQWIETGARGLTT